MEIEDYIINSQLKIYIKPNSNKTAIKGCNEIKGVLVDIAGVPDKNKVNLEVVKFFSKLLKKQQK